MENTPQFNDILLYTTSDGSVKVEVLFEGETFWLSQAKIAELFGKGRSTIAEHLRNIYETQELDEKSVCRKFRQTAADGKNYETQYYNLDAVIAVGYLE